MEEDKKDRYVEPADIIIYVRDRGIVLREKSLIAIDREKCKTIAVGNDVERLVWEQGGSIAIISPLKQGRVTDFIVAREMFRGFFQKAQIRMKGLRRPKRIAASVPKGICEVELKAYEDLFGILFNINTSLSMYKGDLSKYVPPVSFTDMEVNELIQTFAEKYQVIVGITKENPVGYIREQLKDTLKYAKEAGITKQNVIRMLQEEM